MHEKPIVFIGMMGAGKTTIGRSVAQKLGLRFVDNDAEIARRTQKRAADVLREDAQGFRDLEANLIHELLSDDDVFVFSLGGGAVVRKETRDILRERATVVWLNPAYELLSRRVVKRSMDRPMLDGDPNERLRILLEEREPLYRDVADVIVDSGDGTREQVAQRITESFS